MVQSRLLPLTGKTFYIHDLLFLVQVKGLGTQRIQHLLNSFQSFEEIKKLKKIDFASLKLINIDELYADFHDKLNSPIVHKRIENTLNFCDDIVSIFDSNYPYLLSEIYNAPLLLLCKGNSNLLHGIGVSVVGTRHPTHYGIEVTELIAKGLSENGIVGISGFAKGIDGVLHKHILQKKGSTIACMPLGINRIYPTENARLFHQILEQNSLIVSEYLFDERVHIGHFAMRNRIIAGLSKLTIVVEAGENSGALITTRFAETYNREIMAVPGPIFSRNSLGTNALISEGAMLFKSFQDILNTLNFKASSEPVTQISFLELSTSEKNLLVHLSKEPIHIDELADKMATLTYELMGDLLNLEIQGVIKQMEGKRFILA